MLGVLIFMVLGLLAVTVAHGQGLSVNPITTPAQPFRLADVCPGFTISTNRSKAEVYIRCPPRVENWITIQQCADPKVWRNANGKDVDIYCTKPVKA